ncbi:MAG: TonB-dependent receptor [Bacteroidota bacterium]|nr:TonB-dependent receptor [Bacteroidota bacterium]
MKGIIFFAILLFTATDVPAQYSFKAIIKSEKEPLAGATVSIKEMNKTAIADSTGLVIIHDIPAGKHTVVFTYAGYKEMEKVYDFPLPATDTILVFLEREEGGLEEVTVNSTRSNRSINSTPTRVEVIASEEIREEATMRPGDIKMLLSESTGIQTQQTSATSANAGIRIQGLDGRYTQILKDGFPLYAGAATGLGLLQTPPLDLRQVEIIKGAASTLYGGGAIAGLVNLISKIPAEHRDLNFHFNITSAGGIDINGFYGERFKKTGITLFVSRNSNKAYDPANISFSAIPKFERYTINPKLFIYFNPKTQLSFGVNTSFENRLGGDMKFIAGDGDSIHSYFERNQTQRIATQLTATREVSEKGRFTLKNSVSYFNRIISSKGYEFDGTQYSSFTEASYAGKIKESDWVAGVNVLTDHFEERAMLRNYNQNTFGAFVQNTWNALDRLTLETGVRGDYIAGYGFALLPRVSALFKITSRLASRIGGGFGYKPPTIFTEESERLLYRNVLPVNSEINKLERSVGANWDISYHTSFDEITFSINQFFFYTYLKKPLFLEMIPGGLYQFQNIPGHIDTRGGETNIKLGYDDIDLYLGYTYTDAQVHNNGMTYQNPLTPKHRFNAALVYEIENKWKIGSELYYFSRQELTDGSTGRDYWLAGLVAEKVWKKFSLYINFENFGDIRQTRFESIYTGSVTNPVFKDIYAPLDGFVMNGGFKIRL